MQLGTDVRNCAATAEAADVGDAPHPDSPQTAASNLFAVAGGWSTGVDRIFFDTLAAQPCRHGLASIVLEWTLLGGAVDGPRTREVMPSKRSN
jgi:hypothetical protein